MPDTTSTTSPLAAHCTPSARRAYSPLPPLNLVGDYGGGGAFLAAGLLAALLKAKTTKQGQVVDVAMIDGVANLMALPFGRFAAGEWRDTRGENL